MDKKQFNKAMQTVKNYVDEKVIQSGGIVFEPVQDGEIMTSVEEAVSCTGILLSSNSLSFKNSTAQTLTATITPTDCTENVSWSVSPKGIVTVENGLVTPIANGDAIITVTCGSYSASCNVNVTGIVVLGNLVISKNSMSIKEGENDTFEITLDSQPNINQVVTISVNNANTTVNMNNLTFTSDNYNVAQTVTVTATDNSVVGDTNTSVVTITSDGVNSKTINVTVVDND